MHSGLSVVAFAALRSTLAPAVGAVLLAGILFGGIPHDAAAQPRNPALDVELYRTPPEVVAHSLWFDGTTLWMEEGGGAGATLHAYDLATRTRKPARNIAVRPRDRDGSYYRRDRGIWSDGETMWVARTRPLADREYRIVLYAYDLAAGTPAPDRNIETDLQHYRTRNPVIGISSDGTTMWVVADNKLYAYDLATGIRDPARDWDDFQSLAAEIEPNLPTHNFALHGLGIHGTTMWVIALFDIGGLYAYDLTTRARNPSEDFSMSLLAAAGNERPLSLWSDGTTMWVAQSAKLFAYERSTKRRDPGRDFNDLAARLVVPASLWSDGTTQWVRDRDGEILAYDLATRTRDPARDFLETASGGAWDGEIWSDGRTLWLAGISDVEAWDMATHTRDPGRDITQETMRAAGNGYAYGLWSDGVTMYVSDAEDRKVYAYNLATRTHVPTRDLDLTLVKPDGCCGPYMGGIWSDGTTIWAGEYDVGGRVLLAHDLATGSPDPARNLDITGAHGTCVWSDGTTMWFCDGAWPFGYDVKLRAFDLETGTFAPDRTWVRWMLNPDSNTDPGDLFSDGTTMWVMNARPEEAQFFAYDLLTGAYNPANNFAVWDPIGTTWTMEARAVWFDGRTLYLVWSDHFSGFQVVAFDMQTRTRVPARDIELPYGRPVFETSGIWSDGTRLLVNARKRSAGGGSHYAVLTFDLATGTYLPERDLNLTELLPEVANNCIDIWSDGATLWVSCSEYDGSGPLRPFRLHALDLATRTRDPAKDMDLQGTGPTLWQRARFWSDGARLWMSNTEGSRLLAYDLGGGAGGGGFTEPGIVSGETTVKAVHMMELRERVDGLRRRFALPAWSWTDPVIVGGVTPVRAVHFLELRTALNQAYGAARRSPPGYTDALLAGVTPIAALHVEELRRAVRLLE